MIMPSPADAWGTIVTLLGNRCRLFQRRVRVIILRYNNDLIPCKQLCNSEHALLKGLAVAQTKMPWATCRKRPVSGDQQLWYYSQWPVPFQNSYGGEPDTIDSRQSLVWPSLF